MIGIYLPVGIHYIRLFRKNSTLTCSHPEMPTAMPTSIEANPPLTLADANLTDEQRQERFVEEATRELRQVVPAGFEQKQGSMRVDVGVTDSNRLQASYFGSDFPSTDPFPDPSTLTSPFQLS